MRFLMVTSFYPPHSFGGDATYVRQLSQGLAARGHEVRVIYCYDAYRMSGGHVPPDAATADGPVSVRRLASPYGGLSALISQQTGRPGLKGAALAEEFAKGWDVIHFHNVSLIGGPAVLAQCRAPVKLLTAHDHWLICASHILWKNREKACDGRTCFTCQIRSRRPPQLWRMGGLMQRSLAHVDEILAPSAYIRDTLRAQAIDRPISVLANFVPASFERLAEPVPGGRPQFLFVGRVTRSKGIDALARLFRQRPDYDLLIAGDGDLLDAMRATFAGQPNIRFLGRQQQEDLARLYRSATAVMLPSLAPETFGLTTIESFSQATPAIVRDAGGAGEPVRASGAGFVYREDAECLAAMDALASDATRRDEMGRAARRAYEANYREEQHIADYLARIAAIAGDGARRQGA